MEVKQCFDRDQMEDPSYSWGWFGVNVFIVRVLLPLFNLKPTDKWLRYGVSKLANVLFMRELERKINAKDGLVDKVISVACHPGYANTNLQATANMSNWEKMNANGSQSAADGSLPLLMAAVGADIKNGDYTGPSGTNEMTGPPKLCRLGGNGNDADMASSLWEFSEEATKQKFDV